MYWVYRHALPCPACFWDRISLSQKA
jgi:hypothetical protein